MNMKNALAFVVCCIAGAASSADMEIRWHLGDGSTEIEHREMKERDGVSVFALARSEIVARKASSVELTPDFARAKKGDRGFWVVSSGEAGTFRCDDGKLDCNRWQLMSFYGMQTPENEPPLMPVVTFDRVADIAREFKRQGVDKAEFCLVGWQIGGHDGRWPQVFPVEAKLGGEERLRECIREVRDLGYLIVPHGNYLDAYVIAESWDEEWLAKGLSGSPQGTSGCWGGGRSHRICARRAYERFMSREMRRMAALGFKGLGYFDVSSIVPADRMGENDLHCGTDDELRKSVAVVKQGWDVYAQLSHLQFVFMDDHSEVSPGVWKTSYADGESVIVNYNGRPVVVDGVEVPAEGWRLVK